MSARTRQEQLDAARAFINDVLDLATKYELPPVAALTLFGKVARQIIAARVEQGVDKAQATQQVIDAFMTGAGFTAARGPDTSTELH